MVYEVFECDQHPGEWCANAIDHDGEYDAGAIFVAIFSGPLAEERAREYAKFKMEEARGPRMQGGTDAT